MKKKATWGALAVILLLAAFMRVDFIQSVDHHASHDTIYYDKMVRQLLETGIYAYKDTEPNALVTPGYPLLMAAVYKAADYTARDPFVYLRYLNIAFSLANLILLFLLVRRWAGGDWVGLLAALMGAIYPAFVWANGAVLTEVPATLTVTLYLYLQLRAFESRKLVHAAAAGAVLGVTSLIRPEFMPLAVPLYLFYWLQTKDRRFWRGLLAALLGLAVVMSPWWVRNWVTMDRVILSGTQTNPFTAGTYPYKKWDDGLVDPQGKTQQQIGIERLKVGFTEHTWLFVKWYTVGKLTSIYSKMFYGSGHRPHFQVLPMGNEYHRGIVLLALLGMAISLRRWRQPLSALALVIVFMSGIRLLFIPEYRYNFTVMPLLILFSAFAVVTIVRWMTLRLSAARAEKHDLLPSWLK